MDKPAKICTNCEETKQLSEFYNKKGGKFGKMNICKKCNALVSKEYRKNNIEKIKLQAKEKRENNKERISLVNKEFRKNNKEKLAVYKKNYREENKEKIKEKDSCYRKMYYIKNKEKILFRTRLNKKNDRLNLSDSYIKSQLMLTGVKIPKELIQLKRVQILIKRELQK